MQHNHSNHPFRVLRILLIIAIVIFAARYAFIEWMDYKVENDNQLINKYSQCVQDEECIVFKTHYEDFPPCQLTFNIKYQVEAREFHQNRISLLRPIKCPIYENPVPTCVNNHCQIKTK